MSEYWRANLWSLGTGYIRTFIAAILIGRLKVWNALCVQWARKKRQIEATINATTQLKHLQSCTVFSRFFFFLVIEHCSGMKTFVFVDSCGCWARGIGETALRRKTGTWGRRSLLSPSRGLGMVTEGYQRFYSWSVIMGAHDWWLLCAGGRCYGYQINCLVLV